MRLRKKNGQSTLEYLIVLSVLIAVIFAVATGVFRTEIETLLSRVSRKPADMLKNTDMLPEPIPDP